MKVNLIEVFPQLIGNMNELVLTYDPALDFENNKQVTVIIDVADNVGNSMNTEYYSFATRDKVQKPAYLSLVVNEHVLHEPYYVEIEVSDVENLFGVSFVFNYPAEYLAYQSSIAGDFLGSDVEVTFYQNPTSDSTVAISVSKKGAQQGSSGNGIVARINMKEKPLVTGGMEMPFSFTDISALDHSGGNIVFTALDTFYVTPLEPNTKPGIPQLSSPENNTNPGTNHPTLEWEVPSDADGDSLHFRVEIATDENFSNSVYGSPFRSTFNPTGFNPSPPLAEATGSCSFAFQLLLPDGDYWWRVTAYDGKVYGDSSETWKFIITPTSTENRKDQIPKEFTIYPNYPNPFNPTTTITYSFPKASNVKLQIFDLNGRSLRLLVNDKQPSGIHSVQWDATDEKGTRVTSGIYICSLIVGEIVLNQKLILVK